MLRNLISKLFCARLLLLTDWPRCCCVSFRWNTCGFPPVEVKLLCCQNTKTWPFNPDGVIQVCHFFFFCQNRPIILLQCHTDRWRSVWQVIFVLGGKMASGSCLPHRHKPPYPCVFLVFYRRAIADGNQVGNNGFIIERGNLIREKVLSCRGRRAILRSVLGRKRRR